jgi:hypothetical protein
MLEKKRGEIITDQASAKTWAEKIHNEDTELSERAKGIALRDFLLDSELEYFFSELERINYQDPEGFLRTRILKFIEAKKDRRVADGLIQYIKDDISLVEIGII